MFHDAYRGKSVLVTGHTGFKGSWLCLWLSRLGAVVSGYARPPVEPCHLSLLDFPMRSVSGEMRDSAALGETLAAVRPEIVFHLAAQPLVRESYRNPLETFETNVMGTANLLDACRRTPSVKAVVVITTDKCYENKGGRTAFREGDPLGGEDPYSASKAASELVAACWRASFFKEGVNVATARAGNVIGGGDWAPERLLPDLMRAAETECAVTLRLPGAIRPWQHVLEALSGYLLLGEKLLSDASFASAWNFGPLEAEARTVLDIAELARKEWPAVRFEADTKAPAYAEAARLTLDSTKAVSLLGWRPVWDTQEAVRRTVAWYRAHAENGAVRSIDDLEAYVSAARRAGLEWAQ